MPTVIRASQPAELLSLVPALAGYTPRRSLVLLPFRERFSMGVMRLELPTSQSELPTYAAQAVGMLCRVSGADAVALFVYEESKGGGIPQDNLVKELLERFELCGFALIEALSVTDTAWADYRDQEAGWYPLPSLPDVPALAGVGDVTGDQSSGAILPKRSAAERAAIAEAVTELEDDGEQQADHRSRSHTSAQQRASMSFARELLVDIPAFFERMLWQHEQASPFELAALSWCLNRPHLRDVALVQWARTAEHGVDFLAAQLSDIDGDECTLDTACETLLGRGERPDFDRLARALSLARHAAASLPDRARVGALVSAGWLAWALGRSSHANIYLEHAKTLDPAHTTTALVQEMVNTGMLPEWLFTPRTEG